MVSLASVESQYAALSLANYGAWEGSFAQYSRDGVETGRQPCILYVWVDSVDDEKKVLAGKPPLKINFTLRRCETQRDGSQTFFANVDLLVGGRVLSSCGSMCSSAKYLSKGVPVFLELNLNHRPGGPSGPILGRARVVLVYEDGGGLRSISVFRERAREVEKVSRSLPPFPCTVSCANEDFLLRDAPKIHACPSSLAGTWDATSEVLGPNGLFEPAAKSTRIVEEVGSKLVVKDTGMPLNLREVEGQVVDVEATRDGDMVTCATLTSGLGVEHLLMLGGGLALRLPLVFDANGSFCVDFSWLVEDGHLVSIKRIHEEGAWTQSRFSDERRV